MFVLPADEATVIISIKANNEATSRKWGFWSGTIILKQNKNNLFIVFKVSLHYFDILNE